MTDDRLGGRTAYLLNDPLEDLSIFTALDRIDIGTDQLGAEFFERATLKELHRCVERSLATERRENCIRAFLLQNLLNHFWSNWFNICRICKLWIGHDRCWIRIDEDDANSLFAEDAAGLRS